MPLHDWGIVILSFCRNRN